MAAIDQKKYKVIFDTNVLYQSDNNEKIDVLSRSLSDAAKFVKDNQLDGVILAVPELVVSERIAQVLREINDCVKNISSSHQALTNFGFNFPQKKYKRDFKKTITKRIEKIVNDLDVQIIKTPSFNQKDLINRCLGKLPPFTRGAGDKGFKDTLIWLTLLDDARKNSSIKYVLCTNNKSDFVIKDLDPEFKKFNNTAFFIVPDVKDLKSLLDSELELDLELKEINKKIENEIKNKTGELTVQFNAIKLENSRPRLNKGVDWESAYASTFINEDMYGVLRKDDVPIAYDFVSIDVSNIIPLTDQKFKVVANFSVKPRYKEDDNAAKPSSVITRYSPWAVSFLEDKENYIIDFIYNQKNDSVDLSNFLFKTR